MAKKKLQRIKSGLLDRGLSVTKLAIQSSASLAANTLKHALSDQEAKDKGFKKMLETQAKVLAKELGQLKGSLMKVGQMLSLYGEHFFPEEVVDALKSLNESSPPLHWDAIEKIIKRRLKPEQLEKLAIEQEALAAASMGQVHLATIKDSGEIICLKVQYPGVSKAIDSDIKTLRSLLALFKLLPHKNGFEEMFQEIKSMLKQEMDYNRELKYTDLMGAFLEGQNEYIVPRTFPEYSGAKIMASSYCPGHGFDSPEVQSLSQARRNRLGENFARLFLDELFVHNHVQTDPHFGNYKVKLNDNGDDQIILLDFGALRRFNRKFIDDYRNLLKGAIHKDRDLLVKSATGLGFLFEDDSQELKDSLVEIAFMAVRPWLQQDASSPDAEDFDEQGFYLWGSSNLPSLITKKASEYALTFKLRPPPREVIFLDRKIGGVFITLKTLDARFDAWSMIQKYI